MDLSKSFNPVSKPTQKKKEKSKYIKAKKHRQTKATEIAKWVKEIVWERDKHRCIFCHKQVPLECACCHFIPRSAGGLGIPENIYTGCSNCHQEQDNGLNTKEYDLKVENHLKGIYGANWDKSKLIYKKVLGGKERWNQIKLKKKYI